MGMQMTVHKLNSKREETWRYTGQELRRTEKGLLIEAYFNRDDTPFHNLILKRNDRFVEAYFFDRWYNIFEMYDRDDGSLKGWYCNVTTPAELHESDIRYVDLALDLLVYPDGRQLTLDEDEFEAEQLDQETQARARQALEALKSLVQPERGFRLAAYLEEHIP